MRSQSLMEHDKRMNRGTYLQCEYSLAVLELAPSDRATGTFTQAAQLNDLLLFAGRVPALIIQVFDVERATFLQTQPVQVERKSTHAILTFQVGAAFAIK